MKRTIKPILGVTLLEIMLVMAIAAMVIVMSIRYYQQATSNQRVASYADMITGIMAASVSYLQTGGTYGAISGDVLAPYLPGNVAPGKSPWGTSITVGGGDATAGTFTVTLEAAPPVSDCAKLSNLIGNPNNPKANIRILAPCTTTTIAP